MTRTRKRKARDEAKVKAAERRGRLRCTEGCRQTFTNAGSRRRHELVKHIRPREAKEADDRTRRQLAEKASEKHVSFMDEVGEFPWQWGKNWPAGKRPGTISDADLHTGILLHILKTLRAIYAEQRREKTIK